MKIKWMFLLPMLSFILGACDHQPEPKDPPPKDEEVSEAETDLSTDFVNKNEHGRAEQDIILVQRIKQALASDNTLSYGAKNINIYSTNGIVLLEGHVRSEHERAVITGKVRDMYEVNGIENHLEISQRK